MTAKTTKSGLAAILRDPLIHFLAIGTVIFGATQVLAPKKDDPRTMVVDQHVYGELAEVFVEVNERVPNPSEMNKLLDRWVMNETLYREAIALGLHDGDDMIRERTMQKMRVLIQNSVIIDPPADDVLRTWFEANSDDFSTPAILSFKLGRVDGTEAEAKAAAQALTDGASDISIYPFRNRPRPGVVGVFGADFVETVEQVSSGQWHPIETPNGWQVVKLENLVPAVPAEFESSKSEVAAAWEEEQFRKNSTRALESMIDAYRVEVAADYDPQAFFHLVEQKFGQVAEPSATRTE